MSRSAPRSDRRLTWRRQPWHGLAQLQIVQVVFCHSVVCVTFGKIVFIELTWRNNCKCLTNWSSKAIFCKTFFLSGFSISVSRYETPSIRAPELIITSSGQTVISNAKVLTQARCRATPVAKAQIATLGNCFRLTLGFRWRWGIDLNHFLVQVGPRRVNVWIVVKCTLSHLYYIHLHFSSFHHMTHDLLSHVNSIY